ncbi:MAG: type II secretion system F family protein [bacterium]|nr:type II secretion system F family protein [bacterium]
MNLRIEKRHQVFIGIGVILLFVDLVLFIGTMFFLPLIAVAVTIAWLPFWMDIFRNNKRQKELESRFPDFVRNLTGAIKSGMPAAQAVIHVSDSDYGSLTPHVKKLANQIEWAIPFKKAFVNFGKETNNPIIRRAIATVIQAEQAGGNIEDVLSSITDSLLQIKRIREERKSSIHAQVMQSYIIFFVFLAILVLIQNVLIPNMTDVGAGTGFGGDTGTINMIQKISIDFSSPPALISSLAAWVLSFYGIFLMIALIQGLFAGIVLGKMAEGDATSGLKHSLIMMTTSFIIITFAQGAIV